MKNTIVIVKKKINRFFIPTSEEFFCYDFSIFF